MITINPTEVKVQDGILLKLYQKLEEARNKEKQASFNLVRYLPSKSGFQVKVGGLYGFIALEDMPWAYSKTSFWRFAAPHLTKRRFKGRIEEMSSKPLNIRVAIGKTNFTKPRLLKTTLYKGVVLHKTAQYMFIDLGMYSDWRTGSIIGIAYRHSYENDKTFNQLNVGDACITSYHGFTKKDMPILEIKCAMPE